MKIRQDYVTNSSSSSFILAFQDKNEIEQFKEDCEFLCYEEFYKLIENFAIDTLEFNNETRNTVPIRSLIDRIKNIDFGIHANLEIQRLYSEDYQIEPWGTVSVPINPFGECDVDVDALSFKGVDEEGYSIEVFSRKDNTNKDEAIQSLRWIYGRTYIEELLNSKFDRNNYDNYYDYYDDRKAYEQTDEYKTLVDTNITDEDFFEKKEKIENAELIVTGMIWDTSGGILEWAIRNGFIENEMCRYCVNVLNVG